MNPSVEQRISEVPRGSRVLIHHNDEAGVDWFSVEPENDVGNWINSFEYMADALAFIKENGYQYDPKTGFRDTRYKEY
jgi:hypothetical protein